jgi:hypothetical protein
MPHQRKHGDSDFKRSGFNAPVIDKTALRPRSGTATLPKPLDHLIIISMVAVGIEPTLLAEPDFESGSKYHNYL